MMETFDNFSAENKAWITYVGQLFFQKQVIIVIVLKIFQATVTFFRKFFFIFFDFYFINIRSVFSTLSKSMIKFFLRK